MVASGSSFNSPCASLGRGLTGDAITGPSARAASRSVVSRLAWSPTRSRIAAPPLTTPSGSICATTVWASAVRVRSSLRPNALQMFRSRYSSETWWTGGSG